ncbi:MAG: beta-glucosidase [Clostridia bacterium]|nr:beta-glucosidase [Clostridia bacterium]
MYQDIIRNLSLEEKMRFTSGAGAWHTWDAEGKLPQIMMCDGPHGLRKQKQDAPGQNNDSIPATCFPTESALACSWNPEAVRRMAQAIAQEAIAEDVSIVLGCGVNMKRSPLCGRNFEYFSEDPYLAGTLAVAYIKAMQEKGVGTSLKHFAGNNQETHRQTSNSQIDERALREIYLSAFEMAVKEAKPLTVMASYNRLNGIYACENRRLLVDILRQEWGYEGTVISDWGACVNWVECIAAGMDLEMPDSVGLHIPGNRAALENKMPDIQELERAASNVGKLVTYGKAPKPTQESVTGEPEKNSAQIKEKATLLAEHHKLAVELEKESAVLLKNEDFFPIDAEKTLLVVGELAQHMRYQGGGSSHINASQNTDVITSLQQHGCNVLYCQGYESDSDIVNAKLEQEVIVHLTAKENQNTTILFFGGLSERYEGEGYDRKSYKLPENQTHLLEKMREVNPQIGVITFSGAPFEMPFAKWVPAIMQMYLGGQGVGEACAALLLGQSSPCGKLAESWPISAEDIPCYGNFGQNADDVEYRESIFIGYRYYDTYQRKVSFPFGHGLTYTKFEYSDLQINWKKHLEEHGETCIEGQKEYFGGELEISCHIKNIGSYPASEVVQLYVKNPDCNYLRAAQELRGYQKVYLEPGQEAEVNICLNERSFSIYAEEHSAFIVPAGEYEITIATSSRDPRLKESISVKGISYERDDRERLSEYFQQMKNNTGYGLQISGQQFEVLYGRPLSHLDDRKPGEFDIHDSLECLAKHSLLGKLFMKIAEHIAFSMYPDKKRDDPEVMMTLQGIHEGCLDSVMCQSGGVVPYKIAEAIVLSANKHPLLCIKKLCEKNGGSYENNRD